jgi:hypothetical protein
VYTEGRFTRNALKPFIELGIDSKNEESGRVRRLRRSEDSEGIFVETHAEWWYTKNNHYHEIKHNLEN